MQADELSGDWRLAGPDGTRGLLTLGEAAYALAVREPGRPLVCGSGRVRRQPLLVMLEGSLPGSLRGKRLRWGARELELELVERSSGPLEVMRARDAELARRGANQLEHKYSKMASALMLFVRGGPNLHYRDVALGWHQAEL